MRVHWIQHADHEGLGCIGPWLKQQGHTVTHSNLSAGDSLPAADRFDWLIVMGGPMNIYEHERHPWLEPEKRIIHDACVMNKRVLGICLGSQLIADVLGGPVTKNPHDEIGWFDVTLSEDGRQSPFFNGFPDRFPSFHWHGDTFAIPPGCRNLASSPACRNQAFAWGKRVLGLQFHPEVTLEDARRWLALETPLPQRYVQSAAEILGSPERFDQANRLMIRLLEKLADA
jgi:GMP synthase-like glutamine amidotransferase